MRNLIVLLPLGYLFASFSPAPCTENINDTNEPAVIDGMASYYYVLQPGYDGLSNQEFDSALKVYRFLPEHKGNRGSDGLIILDFSRSVRQKNIYINDIVNRRRVADACVVHGRTIYPPSWLYPPGFTILNG